MTNHSFPKEADRNWIAKAIGASDFSLTPLAGDGSSRSFFRVQQVDRTWVLLVDRLWTQTQDYPAHQSFLAGMGVPVPKFFAQDPEQGLLLMEDLGDRLLQSEIQSDLNRKMAWLEKAVTLIGKLHAAAFPVPPELPVSTRRFDQAKYLQEFQFTFEHLYRALLKLPPPESLKAVENFAGRLGNLGPSAFSHRDYHCRNLLVNQGSLWLIDFQDARLGPPQYDLASLFYDAYLPMDDEERNQLLSIYQKAVANSGLEAELDWTEFGKDIKYLAYQRTLKAAGSFASFYTRFGKTTHLQYLRPALLYAQQLEKSLSLPKDLIATFQLEKAIELVDRLKLQ